METASSRLHCSEIIAQFHFLQREQEGRLEGKKIQRAFLAFLCTNKRSGHSTITETVTTMNFGWESLCASDGRCMREGKGNFMFPSRLNFSTGNARVFRPFLPWKGDFFMADGSFGWIWCRTHLMVNSPTHRGRRFVFFSSSSRSDRSNAGSQGCR